MDKKINILIALPLTLKMAKENFIKGWLPDKWESYYQRKKVIKSLDFVINIALQEDKWISVDKPPKESCDLILLQNDKVIIGGYSKEKKSFCSLMGFMDSYLDANRTVIIRPNGITHWQLLPKPPITKKRGGCNS